MRLSDWLKKHCLLCKLKRLFPRLLMGKKEYQSYLKWKRMASHFGEKNMRRFEGEINRTFFDGRAYPLGDGHKAGDRQLGPDGAPPEH